MATMQLAVGLGLRRQVRNYLKEAGISYRETRGFFESHFSLSGTNQQMALVQRAISLYHEQAA